MKLSQIINSGTQKYVHHYNGTAVGEIQTEHTIECPAQLRNIIMQYPETEIVQYGDWTLGIQIAGKIHFVELPHREFRKYRTLPKEAWQYCHLAMGHNGDICEVTNRAP